MSYNVTREREAGRLYSEGAKAVSSGGYELRSLAMHMILMIKGTANHPGALWPVREWNNGKVVRLDRFIDYLLWPMHDGLGLPSLYFLKRALDATPRDGERALAMVRSELAKENVDFDRMAREDELELHGERAPITGHGGDRRSDQVDNINLKTAGGTSAAYLAARLKRDHPDIARELAAGKFRSVRAAAKAAGLVYVPNMPDQLWKLWLKATAKERAEIYARITNIEGCDRSDSIASTADRGAGVKGLE